MIDVKGKNVFLIGPMTDMPHFNVDAFSIAHDMLKKMDVGYVCNPAIRYLTMGASKLKEMKRRDGRQQRGIGFFLAFTALDHVPKVAIENPVGIMSNLYRKPDQIIQPWQFGHPEQKATCLWLKGLPKLIPTNDVSAQMAELPKNERERLHYLPPSAERGKLRSKTFPGIAKAMAEQWTVEWSDPQQQFGF